MPYRLNVDMWHPVNPEDQKITRLSRGDEVPEWALPEGEELDAVAGPGVLNPLFLKDEEKDETPRGGGGQAPADDLKAASSASPQQPRDKK